MIAPRLSPISFGRFPARKRWDAITYLGGQHNRTSVVPTCKSVYNRNTDEEFLTFKINTEMWL